MDDDIKTAAIAGVVVAIFAVAVIWVLASMGLIFNRVAAPYAEETRTQTYETSRTYNHGMAVDLDNFCRQWRETPDATTKSGLADTIRLRAARYDSGKLPTNIQRCLEEIK